MSAPGAERVRPALARRCRTGTGSAPGTFGELLQGVLPGSQQHFLVTLPIMRGSTAQFRWDPSGWGVAITPDDRRKAARVAARTLRHLGVAGGGMLTVQSELPVGKGLASSSADLVATVRAVAAATGRRLAPAEVESLLRGIEPSDGGMYPGAVAFYHREVRLREQLGALPPLTVVGVDEGGEVDTVEFNRVLPRVSAADRRGYGRLLATLAGAVRARDTRAIGRVATSSAIRNQAFCRKRQLPELIDICRGVGGLGVAVAHSGTVLGVLLDERDPAYPDRLSAARQACAGLGAVTVDRSARERRAGAGLKGA